MIKNRAFTRRKALALVLLCALAILAFIALRYFLSDGGYDMSTLDGREAFLNELGWQINRDSEEFRSVVVPKTLEGIMSQYNKMQLAQGYDLNQHLGEECRQYSYELTNYPDSDSVVYVTLYVQGKELIAGDIHTNSVNGFMHGLKTQTK